jgi:hypothetical protein
MNTLLDLDIYPLDRPESAKYSAIVAKRKARLATEGMFDLPGFMRPDVTKTAADATKPAMATESFRRARRHNI